MKRHLSGAIVALTVICLALVASACNVPPPAASSNGATISTSSLNSQLQSLESTVAGGCYLQLESPQLTPGSAQVTGGPGTYTMPFAVAVLEGQVGDLLAEQYATSKGITVSSAELASAKSDFASTLNGEISQAVQQSTSEGVASYCEDATGTPITGTKLLAGLPADLRDAQIRNQAFDEKLLADGADLSNIAVLKYYAANQPQFTADCVSVIVTQTKDQADQIVAQLNGGAAFATVAKASSLDTQTAPNGGSLGCTYTQAGVEQALGVQAITVGQPLPPVQDPTSQQWAIYEVTSQQVESLTAAASVIRRELLQATGNVERVSKEIAAFGARSDVSVDPRYGTWTKLAIVPPVAPPTQYLLAAVSGTPTISTGPSLGTGSTGTGSGTTGAGTTGAGAGTGSSGTAPTGTGSTSVGG